MSTKSFIGGARIGEMKATIPFARLLISNGKLALHCFRKFDLTPKEVICEPVGRIPLLSSGIQFHHIRAEYPWPIIFWCIRRNLILECLRKAGFEVQ
jgi:hypothetical protein